MINRGVLDMHFVALLIGLLLLRIAPISSSLLVSERESTLQKIPMLVDPSSQIAVTYELNGGRVGDSLISYFHAKWIAMEYGFSFLYHPFPDSGMFYLSDHDQKLSDFTSFPHTLTIKKKADISKAAPGTLIVVPFFPDSPFEFLTLGFGCDYFPINWNDPEFKKEVRRCLHLKTPIKSFALPKDALTIAVHVRRGGTWENYDSISRILPLKFPPYSYYIQQIQQVARLFPHQSLYVYIFTDDLNPGLIARIFKEAIQLPSLTIDWNHQGTFTSKFEEFYAMSYFDCLIRPASNFSLMASQLNDIPLVIAPTHCYFDKGKIVIDEVDMQFSGNSSNNLEKL